MSNPDFISRAPESIILKEKQKLHDFTESLKAEKAIKYDEKLFIIEKEDKPKIKRERKAIDTDFTFDNKKIIITFDKTNSNCILIHKEGRLINAIACPPIKNGCDIISFGDKLDEGYTYNFDGLILMSTEKKRKLYYKGYLIAKTKR